MKINPIAAGLAIFLSGALAHPQASSRGISLEWLARDTRETVSNPPFNVSWSKDGATILYSQYDLVHQESVLRAFDRSAGTSRPATRDEEKSYLEESKTNARGTLRVFIGGGDVFLEDLGSKKIRAVTRTTAIESAPLFLRDGRRIAFEREGNAFIYDPGDGTMLQLTDIRAEAAPKTSPDVRSVEQTALEKEQRILFKKFEKTTTMTSPSVDSSRLPRPFYLGGKSRRAELSVSPDGRHVALAVIDETGLEAERSPVLPKYVTESGFVEVLTLGRARLKAGAAQAGTRIAVYDAQTGETRWPETDTGGREANHYFYAWSPDGTRLFFYVGALDLKDLWMAVFDAAKGATTVIQQEHDDAWIRDIRGDVLGLMPGWLDDETIYFLSERDGWNHLYLCRVKDGRMTQLTSGSWEIEWFRLSRDRTKFYFLATKDGPAERPLYSVPTSGGPVVRLPSEPGWYRPVFSPDESQIGLLYSDAKTPQELYVMDNRPGASMKKLTETQTAEFSALNLEKPRIVTFPDGEGFTIYGNLFLPRPGRQNGAAIIHAHGTGYAQAVTDQWSDEYLVHHFLAAQGYAILSIDFVGSSGYGRAGRVAVHRKIGSRDVDSAVAAKDYLVRTHGVDPSRVGIIGGSYGGFYVLMALFTRPGVFAAGVALYPCTDWFQYSDRFVKRFLGPPSGNEALYRKCSPIYQAEGLADPLLLFHGLEDGNVFAQDTIRLAQRLIELKKDNWEYHLYPTEGHGWRQEASRLDYLKRLAAFFKAHLIGGKRE